MSKKNLIIYYSWSNNTKNIAEMIYDEIGGGFFEINPKEPYPTQYSKIVGIGKEQVWNSIKPELLKLPAANYIDFYDNIFLGSPMWWGSMAPCIATLLNTISFKGKTIIPFISHGGSGVRDAVEDMKAACPDSEFLPELSIYEKGGKTLKQDVHNWLKEISIIQY